MIWSDSGSGRLGHAYDLTAATDSVSFRVDGPLGPSAIALLSTALASSTLAGIEGFGTSTGAGAGAGAGVVAAGSGAGAAGGAAGLAVGASCHSFCLLFR